MLLAGGGDDRLDGGAGSVRLSGGSGTDTFIRRGANAADTVLDLTPGEARVDPRDYHLSIADVNAALAGGAVQELAAGARIDLSDHGGGTILLRNLEIADLDLGDSLF